jgi:hypothetical protein
MIKRFKNTYLVLKQAGIYVPITWYFTLFLVFGWLAFRWLLNQQQVPGSSFSDIFALLLLVAAACTGVLLAFALLSVIISFLFFLVKKRRQQITCKLDTVTEEVAAKGRQHQLIRLHIAPLLRPLLGFVKLRLMYDNHQYSEKFSLAATAGRKKITTLEGVYPWPLPQIREYNIKQVIVYFEDLFQFFSFTVTLDSHDRFFTRPDLSETKPFKIAPRKTEETNIHIEELKKVEGEHVNYKHFESNDDVRRIVWKIYAKNKELVVRMPEVLDPYASHLCLYASFHTSLDVAGNPVAEQPFLDYYKTFIYNTYRQLVKQGFEVQYIPDQQVVAPSLPDAQQVAAYQVSASHWQTNKDITGYLKPDEAAIVILSSLNDPEEINRLVSRYGNQISFVLVRLSKSMKKQHIGHWLQWLFVQPEKHTYEKHKPVWQLSRLRSRVIANEKKITQLLSAYEKPVVI